MKIFNNKFWLVIAVLALGFSISCGDNNTSNKTNTGVAPVTTGDSPDDNGNPDDANDDTGSDDSGNDTDADATDDTDVVATDEPASWGDLPDNVRAYVSSQTCSGGQVVKSNLSVDFSDANLASGLSADQFANLPTVYCNDGNTITSSCINFKPEGALYAGSVVNRPNEARDMSLPSVGLFGLTKENSEITLLPRATVRNESGDLTEVPLVDSGDIVVNVPNTTCGEDVGEIQCDANPCVDAPESHQCTFSYDRCSVTGTSCAEGYTNTTASETGEQFMQVYCTKN